MEEIKKEAERIIDLFKFERGYGIYEDTGIKGIDESQAKQCALICIDEILNEFPSQCPKDSYEMEIHIFWHQVKQYIIDNY